MPRNTATPRRNRLGDESGPLAILDKVGEAAAVAVPRGVPQRKAAALTASELRYGTSAGYWVIAATVLGSGVAALDATVVGIALPTMGREFGADVAGLQWVVTGYLLTLAALLLLGGALGDRYGRRKVFVIGVIWFAAASLVCGLAPNTVILIAARALQGIGGALLVPGSLAILEASFAPGDRSKAIGAWSGLGGVATAVGPFVGGYLIGAVSWRLIFYLNLPLTLAVVAITARHVPESRDPEASGRIDVVGATLAAVGLAGLCYGLIEGPDLGWQSPVIVLTLAIGALALGLFLVAETRVRHPMLPLAVFRSRQFSAANMVTLVVYAGLGGALFLLPIQLQQVAHYTPLQSGASLLPLTAIMLALSARSGALASRIGPRLQMTAGPLIVACGLVMFARVDATGGYLGEVLPAVVVLGLGLATTVAPLTAAVLAAAPAQRAGVASAVNNDVARAAGLLAVAILPAAAGITGASYLRPDVFSAGFRTAMLGAGLTCALGGVLAAFTIRKPAQTGEVTSVSARDAVHCALDAPLLRMGAAHSPADLTTDGHQ
jgi:EmrB/QacA subfamily drug resistance transporter